MKNLFVLLISTLALNGCDKDNDNPPPRNPVDQLPPPTQTGADTAGCLVNGEAFVPKGNFPGGSALFFFYQDGLNLSLAISQKVNGQIRSVNVTSGNQNLHDNVGVIFQ